jgi:hypothetical protein
MSYSQFNLTTLQLPAPTSNMTKAEYKSAYGIDLDEVNIKAFKLVLLGNEKYAINQIKEIEDGYEIYFNGRILSITDTVQTSDEIYSIENAKPIYFHPISIQSANDKYRLSCVILNNSPTPFTMDTFKAFVDSLYAGVGNDARVIVSGGYYDSERGLYLCSVLFTNGTGYGLAGIDSNGDITPLFSYVTWAAIFKGTPSIYDGVNKIN